MQRFLVIVLLVLSVVALGLPAATHAAAVTQVHYTGLAAQAFFTGTDPSGCLASFVFVQAVDERTQQAGQPSGASEAVIVANQYDACMGQDRLAAYGRTSIAPTTFQVDQRLTSATLHTTVALFDDLSQTVVPLAIDLTWAATGDTVYTKERSQTSMPGYRVNLLESGTFRPAVAAGTLRLAGAPNLTPDPAAGEQTALSTVRQGVVEITH